MFNKTEYMKEYMKEYKDINPEALANAKRAWQQKNKEYTKNYMREYRKRRRELEEKAEIVS